MNLRMMSCGRVLYVIKGKLIWDAGTEEAGKRVYENLRVNSFFNLLASPSFKKQSDYLELRKFDENDFLFLVVNLGNYLISDTRKHLHLIF